jgi:hypothetical protein
MTSWMEHLKKFYADKKKSNPDYKYKNAMTDAKSSYHSSNKKTKKNTRTVKKKRRTGRKH